MLVELSDPRARLSRTRPDRLILDTKADREAAHSRDSCPAIPFKITALNRPAFFPHPPSTRAALESSRPAAAQAPQARCAPLREDGPELCLACRSGDRRKGGRLASPDGVPNCACSASGAVGPMSALGRSSAQVELPRLGRKPPLLSGVKRRAAWARLAPVSCRTGEGLLPRCPTVP